MEDILNAVLWGKSFVEINDQYPPFILRSLSAKEINFVDFIYKKEYNKSLSEGILLHSDLIAIYNSVGLWTHEDEVRIKDLESTINHLRKTLPDFEFLTAKKKKIEKEIKDKVVHLESLYKIKNDIFNMSVESRAEEVKRRYMVMLSTEDINEQPFWKNEADFLEFNDVELIFKLAISYYKNNIFSSETIRKLARNPEWRIRWAAAKNGADLFGRPIPQWSEMQSILVYWSQFYDYVFEHPERPAEHVIENDASIDEWVDNQSKKNSGKTITFNGNNVSKKNKNNNHQEQFIMVGKDDAETVKKIQELNPSDVRNQLREEARIIKEKGSISEWNLRKNAIR